MTQIPEENYSPTWPDDRRESIPLTGSELEILTGFLEQHRMTFEQKCAGLSAAQLSETSVSPSTLSLHGLVR
ncbi:MAG: DinB family protein, partial [Actinomycetota bacterium]|nr:DinB family protein [Actinomycetota bacterium]